jgi:Mn2+/Fe2+ NRAMP family transporter
MIEDKKKKDHPPDPLDELNKLPLPKTSLGGMLHNFGPGIILMMTGICTSHIITAPSAGGRFGYDLLWVIPVAYVFKYYGFEMAFRFTSATGKSIMEAYATAWKKWPLWYILITTLLQCAIGQAGRLIAAAAVAYYIFSVYFELPVPMPVYAQILALISVWIILKGNYQAVEATSRICAIVLVITIFMVYLVEPAPASAFGQFFQMRTPEGSWIIIGAFLGLLPTGMDVSLQASEWSRAKKSGLGRIRPFLEKHGAAKRFDPFSSPKEALAIDLHRLPPHAQEYCRRWWKTTLYDYRSGQVLSFLVACIFLFLAAIWIFPGSSTGNSGLPAGVAKIFHVGPWMMIVLLLGVFAAAFSTAFNYFDGWPRVVGACCRNLFRRTAALKGIDLEDLTPEKKKALCSEYNIYRMTMVFSLITSVIIIFGAPKPSGIVLLASGLAFLMAPVIYFLNLYYCFTIIPKTNKIFYPSRFATWFGWGSCVIFTGMSVFVIMTRFCKGFFI